MNLAVRCPVLACLRRPSVLPRAAVLAVAFASVAASAQVPQPKDVIGFAPTTTTSDVIEQLYGWPSIIHTPAREAVA